MGRRAKTGLDYFPKDVNFYDDFKIMELLGEMCIRDSLYATLYNPNRGYTFSITVRYGIKNTV